MRIFLLLFFSFLLLSCNEEKIKPPIDQSFQGNRLPAQESWNSTVFFTDSGRTKAILYAGHLQVFEDTKETLLDSGIKVDFYNEQEIKSTTLTSKKGRVDETTNNLFAIDSVVAVNDSGVVLKSEEIVWRNKERKISTDKFVTIESAEEIIQGYGFESDQQLKNYVIYNITYITRNKKE
ncbi:MAG: LPS export ABC transporter periplasmic protein LptC [Ignavibacteria bacterium]|nr:LPS export ABC transporter periplasmic protein LptC [Ignavibacteria bacterium]MBT8383440.1 LPS export ABC transporter periplasmic protein LptC [Ignavibacteria bacterium]MBT8390715.1 LPS export ABC transporter periplasmic protein LptC [Ignavibacteria bacterium]NNJ53662.1 LPS export ABC transporter periplasmic protein LptC [Ignavibacteriaceae bacterium]NNL22518.1 LPS export ABC transporter periplasmic protein LptC [Ignavibacteriaceae bacterium]